MTRKKNVYIPPILIVSEIKLEHSIAASSTTVTPGGGTDNYTPWIREEDVEVIEKDWHF